MSAHAFELLGVQKEYSGEVPYLALRGIDIEIKRGELVSIIGPSGSGKSTLLHILGCLDRPTTGKMMLDGHDVSKFSDDELSQIRLEKIGFIFQAFNLAPNMSVFKNVELPLIIDEMEPKERERVVRQNLEFVGLWDKRASMPSQLSGGQKQRVAIARALVNSPPIILADEPTGNLDSVSSKSVIEMIANLSRKEGKTVIIVTHDRDVAKMADKMITIMDGKVEKRRN
ncbi:MAG: ABC transporter ATP-binding protein [Candidatus Micrarchaeota archaeon]